jgi:hypothetical protein
MHVKYCFPESFVSIMNKLFLLALTAGCGAAWAQTPATNPMPDGSRDMYIGLGVQSAPRYEGAGQPQGFSRAGAPGSNGATAFLFRG